MYDAPSKLESEIATTWFAPAERDSAEKLVEQRNSILLDDLVDALMQAIPGYAMLINQRRQIVAVNNDVLSVSGVSGSEDLIGKRPGEALNCIHACDAPGGCGTGIHCSVCGAVLAIVQSQETDQKAVAECHVTLSGIEDMVIDMQATATPIRIRGEKYIVFVLQDISSEKRREVLEKVFFHDMINTAGGIHGLASMLVEQDGTVRHLESEYKKWLMALSGNLVDELHSQRTLLTAEKGNFVPECSQVSIRSVLSDVHHIYNQHEKTPGRLLVLVDGPDYFVNSDASVLRRVIGNMTLNALEASQSGDTVTLSVRLHDSMVVVDVHNSGVIPQEIQLQIFKRSFSTKSITGRGIGTYCMKLFGERYLKGKVSFCSTAECGTVFSFSLPEYQ
jgi:signal transduction histidine kinase